MEYKNKKDGKGLYIFLSFFALVCFLTSSSILPFVFDGRKMLLPLPDIMLCYVCTLCAFTNPKKAAIFAVILGFFADLFVNPPTAFSPIVFLACVCVSLFFQRFFARVGTLAIAVSTLPCTLVRILVSAGVSAFAMGFGAAKTEIISKIPVAFFADFACAIVLSFVMRLLCKKLRLKTDC